MTMPVRPFEMAATPVIGSPALPIAPDPTADRLAQMKAEAQAFNQQEAATTQANEAAAAEEAARVEALREEHGAFETGAAWVARGALDGLLTAGAGLGLYRIQVPPRLRP